jgi:L-alanine-DL-glutamate epimerase-like enolase superfamily enzyme
MRITGLKLHVLPRETPALVTGFEGLFQDSGPAGKIQYSLVRVLTDSDIEGHYIVWSEVAAARPNALAETLRLMKSYVVGQDPLDRERIWVKLASLWYGRRGPALAAIDIALWDIAGKAAGLPVYKLLGAYRDKVRAYASGNVVHREDEIVRIGKELKSKGYTAMKLHPIPIGMCAALREAVGEDMDLLYDAVFAHTREEAITVGRELERLNFYWYESPLPPDDIEGYVKLSRRLTIPLTVELLYQTQYREYVVRGAVDYLRTLSGFGGGITEMRKAAALAEAFGMKWEPHSYGGTHDQAANLHVILSTENCAFFELPIEQGREGWFDVGTKDVIRIDRDGYVHGPTKPGLGYEVDWDQVKEGREIEI